MTMPSGLPTPRGALSAMVVRALTSGEHPRSAPQLSDLEAVRDPLTDADFQLALWLLYELHYGGFDGVDPALEWDPLLLTARAALEQQFEQELRQLVGSPAVSGERDIVDELLSMTASTELAPHVQALRDHATRDQFYDFLAAGAVFRLHESDPQALVLPRVHGPAKAALAELLYDEYGGGNPDRVHATLYARALESLGLPSDLSTYVESADAATLAAVNLMSLLGLHRRLRGAALGHFAAYEATSALPCRAIADGARRLGLPEPVINYFDEHVEADAVHEQLAIREVCGALVDDMPELADDVLFGAAACLAVEGLAGETLAERWGVRPAAPTPVSESESESESVR